jgi:hypothetical protein
MAGGASFEEWLDENEDRSYPIAESASRVSIGGGGALPNSLIVDARISAPASYFGGDFFVSSLELLTDGVSIEISYSEAGSPDQKVSSIRADMSLHGIHGSYPFSGVGPHRSVLGTLILGDLKKAVSQSRGFLSFSPEGGRFETSVVHISQPAVDHIAAIQNGRVVARLTGVVGLASGANIRLTRQEDGSIRIDAISGENLSDCPEASKIPVKTVNGVPPDENGDLWLSGSECISVSRNGQSSLLLRDLCSTSCCGCRELETLIEKLKAVEGQASSIRDMVYRAYADQGAAISTLSAYISR